jgi:hypothetical protein
MKVAVSVAIVTQEYTVVVVIPDVQQTVDGVAYSVTVTVSGSVRDADAAPSDMEAAVVIGLLGNDSSGDGVISVADEIAPVELKAILEVVVLKAKNGEDDGSGVAGSSSMVLVIVTSEVEGGLVVDVDVDSSSTNRMTPSDRLITVDVA